MKTILVLIMFLGLLPIGCKAEEKEANKETPSPAQADRPAKWAESVKKDNLENLYRVTPELYRCAQPTTEGMAELKKMGIQTVINLRHNHTDDDEIKGTGLESVAIPINTWHMKDEYVVKFLKTATDPSKQPVLVHCQHGSDRTGTMCAMYRICVQGWSREDAIKEMKEGGYGYHAMWFNLIKYIENVDIGKIKKEAGITK